MRLRSLFLVVVPKVFVVPISPSLGFSHRYTLQVDLLVAIRRVQMDFSWIRRLFRSNKRESTATMGALLERAGQVRSSMQTKEREPGVERPRSEPAAGRPMATRQQPQRPPAGTDSKPDSKPTSPGPQSSPPPPADGGTTSRLLDMKRKREQDGGKKE